jgi:hypothetical protein
MIYIETTECDGSAIYFDIHAAEQAGRGLRVCGTVGDGQYEGEVLVEVGSSSEVTFADAWLGGAGLVDFLRRCGTETLESALIDVVRNMTLSRVRHDAPHACDVRAGASMACEPGPLWQGVA